MEGLAKNFPLQNAATTGNGNVADLKGLEREITFYIVGSAGISAGAIQPETAHDPEYAGTWAPLGSPVTVVVSAVVLARFQGTYGAVRARVSTTVAGGTVDVRLFAN